MNLNILAVKIAKAEGLKKQVNISQIKEIMGLTFKAMAKMNISEIAEVLTKYGKK